MKSYKFLFMILIFLFVMTFTAYGNEIAMESSVTDTIYTTCIRLIDVNNVCAGGLTIAYDNSVFKVEKIETVGSFSRASSAVNQNYRDNAIRVSWASVEPLPANSELIKITFTAVNTNSSTENINFEEIKLMDSDGNIIPVQKTYIAPPAVSSSKSASTDKLTGSSPEFHAGCGQLCPLIIACHIYIRESIRTAFTFIEQSIK